MLLYSFNHATCHVKHPIDQFFSFFLNAQFKPWNEVTFSHDGNTLAGSVNGIQNKKRSNGPIQRTPYGISIGFVDGYKHFQGYMDYVTIYKCANMNVYNKY